MTAEHRRGQDARIDQAVAELQGMIRRRYPTATFEVAPGEDPEGTYVWTTVDIEDTDQVLDWSLIVCSSFRSSSDCQCMSFRFARPSRS